MISTEAKAAYDREYRAKNRARIADAKRAYALANPEHVLAKSQAWAEANRERSNEIKKAYRERNYVAPQPRTCMAVEVRNAKAVSRVAQWRIDNPEKYAAQLAAKVSKPRTPEQKARHASKQSLRCRRMQKACPPWADQRAITAIYLAAQQQGMHVDHVIPLQGKFVSGLHVETNLQLLTPTANYRKRNKFPTEASHAG